MTVIAEELLQQHTLSVQHRLVHGAAWNVRICLRRKFHSNRLKSYTVWNMKTNARPRNHGSRVDFILAASGCCSSADKVSHEQRSPMLLHCSSQKL